MQLDVFVKSLPFIYPFTISGGRTKSIQKALLVRLTLNGVSGYGEATEITYYNSDAEQMAAKILQNKNRIESSLIHKPREFYSLIEQLFPNDSFIRCVLDIAFWDLFGKINQQAISNIIFGHPPQKVLTDYTLGIDNEQEMIRKMKQNPWPVYKMKVGFEGDSLMLNELRKLTHSKFRLDANGAWDLNSANQFLDSIQSEGLEIVEQPLAKHDFEGMSKLMRRKEFQFFADESCVSINDVDRCAGLFHGINIKLTKCGGISPAVEMIEKAKKLGLKVMLGNMNESSIGTSALLQLAGAVDYIDADGPLLLAQDYATGLKYNNGYVDVPTLPGLGVELKKNGLID